MGLENRLHHFDGPQHFFHCLPVEDLSEFNSLNLRQWETQAGPKTFVERFLIEGVGFFPDKMIIPRSIVEVTDIPRIKQLLEEGIDQKYSMGVRTISEKPTLFGNKLPWDMEINTPEKINMFISATLPLWQDYSKNNGLTINQLIIMKNLPEIGTKHSDKNQFVARLRWDSMSDRSNELTPYQLTLEMVSGTNQLRGLDTCMEDTQVNQSVLFRYQAKYSPTRYFLGGTVTIGTKYFIELQTEAKKILIENQFMLPDSVRATLRSEELPYIDTLLTFLREAAVDPNIQLLERFEFFSSIGLSAVEIQGYTNKADKNYARIYGLRGHKDETKTGLDQFTKNIEELSTRNLLKSF